MRGIAKAWGTRQARRQLKQSKPQPKCGCQRNVVSYATASNPTQKLRMPTGKAG